MAEHSEHLRAHAEMAMYQSLFADVLQNVSENFRHAVPAAAAVVAADRLAAHGLAALAFDLLAEDKNSALRRSLRPRVEAAMGHRLRLESAWREISETFAQREIACAAIRGFGAIAAAYRRPDLRPASDIDLLVPSRHMPAAVAVLHDMGFAAFTEAGNLPLRRGATMVEINHAPSQCVLITRLAGEQHTFPHLDEGWDDAICPGNACSIGQLARPWEMLLAALHYAYKHRFNRHIWAMDLLLLGRLLNAEEREKTASLARRHRAEHILAHAIDQAHRLAGRQVLAELRSLLPARDPHPLRRAFLRWCADRATGRDAGYLMALVCSRSPRFIATLGVRMLFPPPADLVRNRLAEPPVRPWHYLRHYLLLPQRLRRLWQRQ